MGTVTIHPATGEDVLFVGENLRAADRMELEHASGMTPVDALRLGAEGSEVLYTAHLGGVPGIVFGVAPGGLVWMVCTDVVRKYKTEVFDLSKQVVDLLLQRYPRLHNRADCRNKLHLRWLRKVGFTFDEVVEVNGLPFQRFHMDGSPDV